MYLPYELGKKNLGNFMHRVQRYDPAKFMGCCLNTLYVEVHTVRAPLLSTHTYRPLSYCIRINYHLNKIERAFQSLRLRLRL